MDESTPNEIVLTKKSSILSSLINANRKLFLLIWYLFQSFCSNIYSRQKVIRNQIVLITGSGGRLGKFFKFFECPTRKTKIP